MLRVCSLFCLLVLLLNLGTLVAAERKPIKASKFQITAKVGKGRQVSEIKKADFYITKDSGQTWTKEADDSVRHPAGKAPSIIFQADDDGLYGVEIKIHYKDGASPKAPQPGDKPKDDMILLIDTTPPQIDTFLSGLLEGTENKLFVEWSVSDKHLGKMPVQLEHSADLKSWQAFLSKQEPKHSRIMPLPHTVPFYIRLKASDRAGNHALSKVILIGSRPPVAAPDEEHSANEAETATEADSSAVQLPSLGEVERDVDAALAQESETPVVEVPPDHQDIIAPYADKPWPSVYTGEKTDVETAADHSTQVAGSEDLPDHSGHKERFIEEDIALILKKRKGRILFGKDAEKVLAAARHAVIDDRDDRALFLYSRLKDSTVAGEALPEEVELLIKQNDLQQAMELVRTAPPEVMNTALRIQHANILIARGKNNEAISVLTGIIPDKTDDYKNARLLLAQCYISAGKTRSARTVLLQLAEEQDSWGQTARSMLGKL